MEAMKVRGLLLEQLHQVLRLGVPGIAAGNEHGIKPRHGSEDIGPFAECELDRLWVGVILVHRRIPDPNFQPVIIEQSRHALRISSGAAENAD
jgi:hypothetical protein